jgi:hypothetical protein
VGLTKKMSFNLNTYFLCGLSFPEGSPCGRLKDGEGHADRCGPGEKFSNTQSVADRQGRRGRIQRGFLSQTYNCDATEICMGSTWQGKMLGADTSGHICRTPDQNRISQA